MGERASYVIYVVDEATSEEVEIIASAVGVDSRGELAAWCFTATLKEIRAAMPGANRSTVE